MRVHIRSSFITDRLNIQNQIGPIPECCAPPMAAHNYTPNIVESFKKRMGRKLPKANKLWLWKLKLFVRKWCRQNLQPLIDSDVPDLLEYLNSLNHPRWRIDQLQELYHDEGDTFESYELTQIEAFVKTEVLVKENAARMIYPRGDKMVLMLGPLIHAMENVLFKSEYFIKHIPVLDRPRYIHDHVAGELGVIMGTDFTAMESHFIPDIMRVLDFELMDWLCPPSFRSRLEVFKKVVGGKQHIRGPGVMLELDARRMSGELNTSMCNGFANLMLTLFLCQQHGIKVYGGVVEGDDGLFRLSAYPESSWYEKLGFTIKIERFKDVSDASFCKLIYESETFLAIRDPCPVILGIGWTHSQRRVSKKKVVQLGLLRAKALSLINELPGCPIINVLAERLIDLTEGITPIDEEPTNTYKVKYTTAIPIVQDSRVRAKFEDTYGISIEAQLYVEEKIRMMNIGDNFTDPVIQQLLGDHPLYAGWSNYWMKCVYH